MLTEKQKHFLKQGGGTEHYFGTKVMSKIVFGRVGPLESTKKHFQEMAHTNFSSRVE